MTPRLPSHAPPFPQPQRALGGGCREGGSPPDFPSCPAALPAGTGRFPHSYRNPQSRLVRTRRPSRSAKPRHGGNRFLSGRGRVRGVSRVRARGPRGPALPRADGASRLRAEGKRAPPGNGQRPFPGQRASAPIACTSCIPPRARSGCSPLHPPRRACGAGWSCACPPCAPRRQSPRPRSP